MATRDIVWETFRERFGDGPIRGAPSPLEMFQYGWTAAIRQVLHHEQQHGHEWVQAIGLALGACDDCDNIQD
jgi:hypothetical protein